MKSEQSLSLEDVFKYDVGDHRYKSSNVDGTVTFTRTVFNGSTWVTDDSFSLSYPRSGNQTDYWGAKTSRDGWYARVVDIAESSNGNIYILNRVDIAYQGETNYHNVDFVSVFDSNGIRQGSFEVADSISNGSIAVDSVGNVYVAIIQNDEVDEIKKFNSTGTYLSSLPLPQFIHPISITVDNKDNVYVVNANELFGILKFDSTGNLVTTIGGIEYSGYDSKGRLITKIGDVEFPRDVAVDSDGNVYVTSVTSPYVQTHSSTKKYLIHKFTPLTIDNIDNSACITGRGEGKPYSWMLKNTMNTYNNTNITTPVGSNADVATQLSNDMRVYDVAIQNKGDGCIGIGNYTLYVGKSGESTSPPMCEVTAAGCQFNPTIKLFSKQQMLSKIRGFLWNDLNSNGLQDSNEANLAGWTVLLKNPNGSEISVVTDANGYYEFTDLVITGDYTVFAETKAGAIYTTPQTVVRKVDFDKIPRTVGFGIKTDIPKVNLTVSKIGNGTVNGGGTYAVGSPVTLTATPDTGYKFIGWNPSTCKDSFAMPANALTCTATFEKLPPEQFTLTVNKVGNGTVNGGGTYAVGSTVNLTATPDANYTFTGWSPSPCATSFVMPNNALTCTATFALKQTGFSCNNVTEIPVSECQSLLELYNSTNGANWTNKTGWNQTNTPCSWFGVSCDGGHVVQLTLDGNQLSGSVPNFSNLPNLRHLDLSWNKLSGSIPNFNLPNLTDLWLGRNQLSGSIPNFNLPNLQYLYLAGNQLSGSIPNFTNLPNLVQLSLFSNQLSGSVPNFSNLPNLIHLALGLDQLSGSIPDFSNLPNLTGLELFSSQLSGSIPNFSNLPNLSYLGLYSNQLSGSIPNFSNLPNLHSLYLHSNQLSGSIPNFTSFNLANLSGAYFNNNCGLTAYDSAQEAVLNQKDSSWKTLNPNCPVSSYNLTLNKTGNGQISGGGSFAANATVNLIATPDEGYKFAGWNPSTCKDSFVMPANALTCTATFEKLPPEQFTLTVNKMGNGTVNSGGTYAVGSTVNLIATPDANSTFTGWSPSPCNDSFVMPNNALTCTANFTQNTFAVTLNKIGNGTITGNGTYAVGSTVNLTATPDAGYKFIGWSPSTCKDSFMTMSDKNLTCTATFEKIVDTTPLPVVSQCTTYDLFAHPQVYVPCVNVGGIVYKAGMNLISNTPTMRFEVDMSSLQPSNLIPNEQCAVFPAPNTLDHLKLNCLDLGDKYWVDLKLVNTPNVIQFDLVDFGLK